MNKTIDEFEKGDLNNLIIVGNLKSGKTILANAIGTELTFKKYKVRYCDFMDFLDFSKNSESAVHLGYTTWDWKECDFIIFDDTANKYVNLVNQMRGRIYQDIISILKTKKIVWVIGDYSVRKEVEKYITENINQKVESIELMMGK